jgi:hypothetical protein
MVFVAFDIIHQTCAAETQGKNSVAKATQLEMAAVRLVTKG